MTRKTRNYPRQSPPIPQNIDPNLKRVLEYFKEQADVGSGFKRGAPDERFVRLHELTESGLASFNPAANGGMGGLSPPSGGAGVGDGEGQPGCPQNFQVSGGYDWIHVSWEPSHGWPITEVWRSTDDNVANAVLIGTVGRFGSQFGDMSAAYGTDYWYWGRHVSADVPPNYGPKCPINGAYGRVVDHPSALLEQLEKRISSSQLTNSLNNYIEGIEVKADHANNQYTIKIGQNGEIAGFGLGFTEPEFDPNDPNHSMALFSVDTFAITSPGAENLAFVVETDYDGNGNSRVMMDAAYITNLVVTDAVISTVNVDKLVGNKGQWITVNIEDASITSAKIAYEIFSENWGGTGGNAGWLIDRAGQAWFHNVFARGDIEATTIKADAVNIVDTLMVNGNAITAPYYRGSSADYTTGSSSWYSLLTSSVVETKGGMSGVLIWAVTQTTSIDDYPWAEIRVVRNGTSLIGGAIGASFGDNSTGSQVLTVFDPTPGTDPTYSIQCRSVSGNNRFRVPRMVIQASYR
ncbi:hypothetical protein [Gilvimarinus chinensis]|uniref:hypothetical protein n=1 Tax=Gilvimarinus chinensis TaxID=396005 RepID=UPI000372AA95|nr:hypothetical protein [Gilvimarinus chinensis]